MAIINEQLTKIKTAVYGEEVRGSIHDSIYSINIETEAATKKSQNAETQAQSANTSAQQAANEAGQARKRADTAASEAAQAAQTASTASKAAQTASQNAQQAAEQVAYIRPLAENIQSNVTKCEEYANHAQQNATDASESADRAQNKADEASSASREAESYSISALESKSACDEAKTAALDAKRDAQESAQLAQQAASNITMAQYNSIIEYIREQGDPCIKRMHWGGKDLGELSTLGGWIQNGTISGNQYKKLLIGDFFISTELNNKKFWVADFLEGGILLMSDFFASTESNLTLAKAGYSGQPILTSFLDEVETSVSNELQQGDIPTVYPVQKYTSGDGTVADVPYYKRESLRPTRFLTDGQVFGFTPHITNRLPYTNQGDLNPLIQRHYESDLTQLSIFRHNPDLIRARSDKKWLLRNPTLGFQNGRFYWGAVDEYANYVYFENGSLAPDYRVTVLIQLS